MQKVASGDKKEPGAVFRGNREKNEAVATVGRGQAEKMRGTRGKAMRAGPRGEGRVTHKHGAKQY